MATLPTYRSVRIIVADDHEWIREILVHVVAETLPQADIIATEDGLQALHAFQRRGADLLIVDQLMPLMDGLTVIRQIRQQKPDVPILMVSVQPGFKDEALAAGATAFLSKTEIIEHLPALLLEHTNKEKAA